MVTAGILVLLFVAYQLWGTGFFEARAQRELRDEFEEQLAARPSSSMPEEGEPAAPAPSIPAPIPDEGDPVGLIRIPRIGLEKVLVEGTTVATLRTGPGHYSGTPLPGQSGNSAIAGHRTTYGAPFGNLDQLGVGDVISVETLMGSWNYRVVPDGVFVVKPSQTEVLDPPSDPDEAILTLTTCSPKYSAAERLIVRAALIEDQQAQPPPATPRVPVSIDAGLSGDPGSRVPALQWGAAVVAWGGLWWLAFHRYRRWTTWFAGAIPFAAILFVFYSALERMLPPNY